MVVEALVSRTHESCLRLRPRFCFRRHNPLSCWHRSTKLSSPSSLPVRVASCKRPRISASARPSLSAVRQSAGVQCCDQSTTSSQSPGCEWPKCGRALLQGQASHSDTSQARTHFVPHMPALPRYTRVSSGHEKNRFCHKCPDSRRRM